jgi:aminobenzoyl-glutamate utilization protein B
LDHQKRLSELVEARKSLFVDMSDQIWAFAEPRFTEYKSSALQAKIMKELGFKVRTNLAGEETALIAEYGSGKPIIGFLGEFDSLSGLSQEADKTEHSPINKGGEGHGCGHNLLGAAAASAAAALKDYMEENKLPGTIRYYGCPAEENAGGKAFLVRDGLFNDVDIAITWHPGFMNMVSATGSLANFRVFYTFHGLSSHAAAAPHLGRSALDAVELMNVGANYMREHMISEARIHYAVINTGGTAPNVVQSEAQVLYAMRAPKVTQVKELYNRLEKIAKGAALMTETEVDVKQVAAYSDYIANNVIAGRMGVHMDAFLPLDYTEEELDYARRFKEVTTDLDKKNILSSLEKIVGKKKVPEYAAMPMFNFLAPTVKLGSGSTDVGDVSWVCPTAQFNAATMAPGTPGHSWQVVAQGKSGIAHKGMLFAAKVMACTGCDFLTDSQLVAEARKDWEETLGGETYPNPLPPTAKPEIW